MAPQFRHITITDVAKEAQTSSATVSHYLNGRFDKMSDQTRQRVAQAVERLGYVPRSAARSLAGKPTGVVAVLLQDTSNAWAGLLLQGVERTARQAGLQTVLCGTDFDPARERDCMEKMLSLGVDGFLVQPTTNHREVAERLRGAGRPVVFFDTSIQDFRDPWIRSDLYNGVYTAVTRCVEAGYERFVYVEAEDSPRPTRIDRKRGFVDALQARGLGHKAVEVRQGDSKTEELGRRLERRCRPLSHTLVVAQNSWALSRVFLALKGRGLFGEGRAGLLGLNCQEWTALASPTVSAVEEPVRSLGEQACAMLVERMGADGVPAAQRILDCATRWRESTPLVEGAAGP